MSLSCACPALPLSRGAIFGWIGLAVVLACDAQLMEMQDGDNRPTSAVQEIDQLRALGYVDTSHSRADPRKMGAAVLDRSRVSPGYSLYTEPSVCSSALIDLDGELVHTWRMTPCGGWMHADLLPNGDLLIPALRPVDTVDAKTEKTKHYLLRMSWNGNVVWESDLPVHHDAESISGDKILAITQNPRRVHSSGEVLEITDNAIAPLSSGGRLLDSISLWDTFRENPIGFKLKPVKPRKQQDRINLFHANSVESIRPGPTTRHPLHSPNNVLVSMRNQDAVVIIDLARRELVWSWGSDTLEGPHDARVLANGNILVFDNGIRRGWSRVLEVDPLSGSIAWHYGDPEEDRFFTRARGSSQRLPNGNTLISISNTGEAREVTPEGEIVWRFWNPRLDEEGKRHVIIRMIRYTPEMIEPLLAGSHGPG